MNVTFKKYEANSSLVSTIFVDDDVIVIIVDVCICVCVCVVEKILFIIMLCLYCFGVVKIKYQVNLFF